MSILLMIGCAVPLEKQQLLRKPEQMDLSHVAIYCIDNRGYIGFAHASANQYIPGPARIDWPCDPSEIKAYTRAMLEPWGLWDEVSFGVWLITQEDYPPIGVLGLEAW